VDGRGVPLSLVVTGANRHDVTQLKAVLDGIAIKRTNPPQRRHKHLCADAGYTGAPALKAIEKHGYIPHVKGRGQEAKELKRKPGHRARRWIVEVAHSWFNRFRKALFANRVSGSRSEPPVVDTGCYGAVASNHPGARNEEARVE